LRASIPPVGQNLTAGNGAATALSQARPPDDSAGKNFSTLKPSSASVIASLTVAQPGSAGTGACASAVASGAGVPGLTRYLAPAATAAETSAGRSTVPAPTTQSATSAAIAHIASSATRVRNVTSITGRPPATGARASGTASAWRSMVSTGITGTLAISSEGSDGIELSRIVPQTSTQHTPR